MTMQKDFYRCDEHGDCSRCGNPSHGLRFIGGQATCANCAEDLDATRYETLEDFVADAHLVSVAVSTPYVTDSEPLCPQVDHLVSVAVTTHGLLAALTAHVAECAACGSTRKTVLSDRWHLGTVGSACCGGIDPDLGEVA